MKRTVICGKCGKEEDEIKVLYQSQDYSRHFRYEIPREWDHKIINNKPVLLCQKCLKDINE